MEFLLTAYQNHCVGSAAGLPAVSLRNWVFIPEMGFCQDQACPVAAGAFFLMQRILFFSIHQGDTNSHLSPNLVTPVTDFLEQFARG
jgi:hypothetical protein